MNTSSNESFKVPCLSCVIKYGTHIIGGWCITHSPKSPPIHRHFKAQQKIQLCYIVLIKTLADVVESLMIEFHTLNTIT